jgi:SNF family Na+-dependent transporter
LNGRYYTARQIFEFADFILLFYRFFLKDLLGAYVVNNITGTPVCEPYDTSDNLAAADGQVTGFSWPIFAGLCITWFLTYFCVFKGVKSSSIVVWFTVPMPIGFIFIMVLNGLCLPNSDEGIRMYLRGETNGVVPDAFTKLSDGQMWADACGQIFFSLGVVMGIMTSYSSYNRRNKPIIRDVMAISFGNCGCSFFSGFAVFSIVGYLQWLDSPVASKTSSSSLAFVAFPAAAETMNGSNFWAGILGLTLFMLGIDSAFSMVEAISTVIYDTEWGMEVPRKLTALIVCSSGFLFSLLFCFSWGYTYFDVVDRYIAVYLMFILGMGECFGAAWMFGRDELAVGDDKIPVMIISITYWVANIFCGILTVFVLGRCDDDDPLQLCLTGIPAYWGVIIFWLIIICAMMFSFLLMKKHDFGHWYRNVFLYGAYQLAMEVVKRSDEAMEIEGQWWAHPFILWWGFSIKYFVPWALWTLMMWNFRIDITPSKDKGKFYGNYHIFW